MVQFYSTNITFLRDFTVHFKATLNNWDNTGIPARIMAEHETEQPKIGMTYQKWHRVATLSAADQWKQTSILDIRLNNTAK